MSVVPSKYCRYTIMEEVSRFKRSNNIKLQFRIKYLCPRVTKVDFISIHFRTCASFRFIVNNCCIWSHRWNCRKTQTSEVLQKYCNLSQIAVDAKTLSSLYEIMHFRYSHPTTSKEMMTPNKGTVMICFSLYRTWLKQMIYNSSEGYQQPFVLWQR